MSRKANAITAPAGSGKTQKMAKHVATTPSGVVEIYTPTHRMGDAWRDSIKGYNPSKKVIVIKGREALDGNGTPLCAKHKLAAELSLKGLSVYPNLCRRSQGKGTAPSECPHYRQCAYIQQFGHADVYIYTHAHLPLERGELETWTPSSVVIDESFFQACLQTVTVPLSLLRDPGVPTKADALCADIHAHLAQHGLSRGLRKFLSFDNIGMLNEAREAVIRANNTKLKPGMAEADQAGFIRHAVSLYPLAVMLQHMAWAALSGHPIQAMDFDRETSTLTIHHRRNITRFDGEMNTKITLLDASASQLVIEPFFTVGTISPMHIPRRAVVTQCHSSRCSNASLIPTKHKSPARQDAAAVRLADVQTLINRLEARGLKVLVVGPSGITGNPGNDIPSLLTVRAGSDLAHFNALRGVDHWGKMDAVVLVGRNQPSAVDVENIARSLYWDSEQPLTLTGQWTTEQRGYRMAGGVTCVDVEVHVDPRVQAVLEQIREQESLQALDRLRLFRSSHSRPVYVLSNVVLDLDVHRLLDWHDLTHGTRLEQAGEALACGVLPLRPAWLSEQFPVLWKTEKAAKEDVSRARGWDEELKKAQNSNIDTIGKMSLFGYQHQYKYPSQRSWSWCLADSPDSVLVQQKLEKLLAESVQMKAAS